MIPHDSEQTGPIPLLPIRYNTLFYRQYLLKSVPFGRVLTHVQAADPGPERYALLYGRTLYRGWKGLLSCPAAVPGTGRVAFYGTATGPELPLSDRAPAPGCALANETYRKSAHGN